MRLSLVVALALVVVVPSARAEDTWRQPPQAVLDVLRAPDQPIAWTSPTGEAMALVRPLRYPSMAEISRPYLRLAGVRVDPRANAIHAESGYVDLAIQRLSDGRVIPVAVPADARVSRLHWSADGRWLAFA